MPGKLRPKPFPDIIGHHNQHKSFITGANDLRVDPGCTVVIILATRSEVRGFKSGRGRWIFPELKNPEYDFLRKGSKTMDPVF